MSGALPPVGATSGWTAVAPSQQQQELTAVQQQQELTAAVARLYDAIRELTGQQEQQRQREITAAARSESAELRNWLMVAATLMVSVTYSAALNPPGGVWQADDAANRYIAGKPVLRDKSPRQYDVFRTFNVFSFGLSLVIIVVSTFPSYNKSERAFVNYLVALDMLFLGAAYVAGSWTTEPYNIVYYMAGFIVVVIVLRAMYDKIWEADQDN